MGAHQHVVSDDPVIEDLLLGILDLVRETGGWFAPELRLRAVAGDISVDRSSGSGPLLHIPEPLWVRVDSFDWGCVDGQLVVLGVPDDAGDVELAMAFLQAGLTNQCGRLSRLESSHPALAADLDSATTQAVSSIIPGFRSADVDVVDALWATRCFRLRQSPESPTTRMLVPLVDLLNHHTRGASGVLSGAVFNVDTRQPFGTQECALDYGMGRDALEMAVVYGFADESALWVHSAPMTLPVAGVNINVVPPARTDEGTRAPLTIEAATGSLVLAGVTLSADSTTDITQQLVRSCGMTESEGRRILAAVVLENVRRVEHLRDLTATRCTPAGAVIAHAAMVQHEVLLAALHSIRNP